MIRLPRWLIDELASAPFKKEQPHVVLLTIFRSPFSCNPLNRYTPITILAFAPAAFADRTAADDESHIDDPRVQHRSYVFEPTGETLPYAIFVPSTYDPNGSESLPLLVSLHGLGRSYDWLMGYHGLLDQAEESGYAVVTPLGYIREGLVWIAARGGPARRCLQ
jgi:poly(3-hydroxybutyrate) depolymerase